MIEPDQWADLAFKKQGCTDTARTLAEAEVLWSDRKYGAGAGCFPAGWLWLLISARKCGASNVPILFLTASDEE